MQIKPKLHNAKLSTTTCPGNDMLQLLDAVNRLSFKQMRYLRGREEDAIASSDITKAPIVTCPTNTRKCNPAIDIQEEIGLRFNIKKEVKVCKRTA